VLQLGVHGGGWSWLSLCHGAQRSPGRGASGFASLLSQDEPFSRVPGERWAGCLPQAHGSGKSESHAVKQKVGELLLITRELWRRGVRCWVGMPAGLLRSGLPSAAGSAGGTGLL